VIRRLFWLIVGAVLGVTGYRRLTQLARSVRPGTRRGAASRRPGSGTLAGGAAAFAHDVREGMELYMDRHPGLTDRTLGGQQDSGPRPGQAVARTGTDPWDIDYAKDGR
jgi:hypothetical protein